MFSEQFKTSIVWQLNGKYFDAIMQSFPDWLPFSDSPEFDAAFNDWFFSQLGV